MAFLERIRPRNDWITFWVKLIPVQIGVCLESAAEVGRVRI